MKIKIRARYKKYYCRDCKVEISDYRRIRCRSCNGKWLYKAGKLKVGKFDFDYKEGISNLKPKCLDCGKSLSDYRAKRCKHCSTKNAFKKGLINIKAENHYAWKGGLPKCIDCGKQLAGYNPKRCHSCENKRKHRLGILNPHKSSYKDGRSLKIYYCIDCGKKLCRTAYVYHSVRCRSCVAKLKWKNPEFKIKRRKILMQALQIKPNKFEKNMSILLNNLFPKTYKYVGNGKRIIEGFCPDFIHIKGEKKIIEFNGDYWHRNTQDKDMRKLRIYKKCGYKTLVIWEHELKTPEKVLDKLIKFNEER